MQIEEARRKRAAEIAEARRLAELRLKNPETTAWNQYKEKKHTEIVVKQRADFIEVRKPFRVDFYVDI
jgi:hypothetical protein